MSLIHDSTYERNIVLIGETGVGKSSLINLIAGQELAQTSNDAFGCTAEPQQHKVAIPLPLTCNEFKAKSESGSGSGSESESRCGSFTVRLWDTAGLDEGTEGTVPAATSITYLKSLLQHLSRSPAGICLLLFCVRGTARMTRALRRHYDLVCTGLRRNQVRIALVVTGLEHQYLERPAGMETWWEENEGLLRELRMQFDGHVCVTTVNAQEGIERERWLLSRRLLQELVVKFTQSDIPQKTEPTWRLAVLSMSHGLARAGRTACGQAGKGLARLYQFYAAFEQWLASADTSVNHVPVNGERERGLLASTRRHNSASVPDV